MGVAAVRDPNSPGQTLVLASDGAGGVIRVFTLDGAGTLVPSGTSIAISPPVLAAPSPHRLPLHRMAALHTLPTISVTLSSRSILHPAPFKGRSPLAISRCTSPPATTYILVSGTGLSNYAPVIPPSSEPQFAQPLFDASKSSTLTVVGAAGEADGDPSTVRMDPAPDGREIVGGAAPGATILTRNNALAYVALANVDRVVVVSLSGAPHVVRGLDLRLYPGAPYGAAPSAEALSSNGKRLYVALAGLNSIAVLDAQRPTRYRYGLIPTAWYPVALALSADGRYLYVLNSKSVNGWGILQRIDLKRTYLVRATLDALRYNRTPSIAKIQPGRTAAALE